MKIENSELAELKNLYKKYYGIDLTDEQATEVGHRLLNFFSVVGKRLPDSPQSDKK